MGKHAPVQPAGLIVLGGPSNADQERLGAAVVQRFDGEQRVYRKLALQVRIVQHMMQDAVLACLVGLIHQLIDAAHHRIDVAHRVREGHRADANRDGPFFPDHLLAEAFLDSLQDSPGIQLAALGQKKGEFIAAEPGKQIGGADVVMDGPHEVAQGLVAGGVPQLVVEPFEIVQIDICQR